MIVLPTSILYSQKSIKITDSETNEPVSFAVISTDDQKNKYIADIDGNITFNCEANKNYLFSRLGYKEKKYNGKDLIELQNIKLNMISYELNPITVNSDAAWKDLNKSIDSTYKYFPKTPYYIKCELQENVEKDKKNIATADATMYIKISKIHKAKKGCSSTIRTDKINQKFTEDITKESIQRFSYYRIPFVNEFLIGTKYDKDIFFYYFEVNDSLIVIGYTPKNNIKLDKNYVITSGRFLIDRNTWKLIRLDSYLSDKMLEHQKEIILKNNKKNLIITSFKRSILLSSNGIPDKLEETINYYFKNDSLKHEWMNKLNHFYYCSKQNEFDRAENKKLKKKPLIFNDVE